MMACRYGGGCWSVFHPGAALHQEFVLASLIYCGESDEGRRAKSRKGKATCYKLGISNFNYSPIPRKIREKNARNRDQEEFTGLHRRGNNARRERNLQFTEVGQMHIECATGGVSSLEWHLS